MQYTLPHFGQIYTSNLEANYTTNMDFGGSELKIDLNFENKTISVSKLENIEKLIENIGKIDNQNKKHICGVRA